MPDLLTWPEAFPAPSDQFQVDTQPATIRTNMEGGTVRQRRRYTTDYALLAVKWQFTDVEYGIFQAFVFNYLNQGSDWFKMSLPVAGGGLVQHAVRFVGGNFKASYVPVSNWDVTATLEVTDVQRFNRDTLDIYLYLGFTESELNGFLATLAGIHNAVHYVAPINLN